MPLTTLVVTALLAQAGAAIVDDPPVGDRTEVGYEELRDGEPRAAIEKIEANPELDAGDPAALINLGNAYARVGQTDKALEHYRAAIASETRYELELADGRWMDSRRAARQALKALLNSRSQAMRD